MVVLRGRSRLRLKRPLVRSSPTLRVGSAPSRKLFATVSTSSLPFFAVEREEMRRGRIQLAEDVELEDEELWTGEEDGDHAGWFCVSTDPFPCPAPGCSFIATFMTAAHLVLVWQERDDPNLLRHAGRAKEVGRNPHVVTYEPEFGPSASYYAWEAAGRPVHGIRGK
jgi:hypothetical protein